MGLLENAKMCEIRSKLGRTKVHVKLEGMKETSWRCRLFSVFDETLATYIIINMYIAINELFRILYTKKVLRYVHFCIMVGLVIWYDGILFSKINYFLISEFISDRLFLKSHMRKQKI